MVCALQKYIQQIAEHTGCQDEKPSQAISQKPAEKMHQNPACENIAEQVNNIGMQGKCCYQAIPLPVLKDLFA